MNAKRHVRAVATALVLVAVTVGCAGTGSSTPTAHVSTSSSAAASASATAKPPSNGPSQSAADARRDGVVAELAAVPFAARVGIRASVVTPEGVWVISRPPAAAKKYAEGCRLGPETGKYPTTTICTTEYGEVLLLDAARSHILRAYPLPSVPPAYLVVTPDAVWCGRQGDTALSETALPDSMVCRIDRKTLQAAVRVFAPGEESEVMQPCFFPPSCWQVTKGRLEMTALQVDARGVWARDAAGMWTRLDRQTLQVLARHVSR